MRNPKILLSRLKILFYITLLFFIFFTTSCSSTEETIQTQTFIQDASKIKWENLENNSKIQYFSYSKANIKYNCIKIDLSNKDLKINSYPTSKSEEKKKLNIKKFIKSTNSKIAINSTPFMKSGKIVGIHISNNEKISSKVEKYSALYFEKDENGGYFAKISENQNEKDFENAENVFGGLFSILKNGEIRTFKHTSYDSRSVVGISSDKKTLFLLSAEKSLFNRGLSYPECAELLKNLGAIDAMQFDGGNSSSFFVREKVNFNSLFRKDSAFIGFNF